MEEGGAKRIVVIVAIAAVAVLGVFWYWQRSKQRALRSGNVYVKNSPATDANSSASAPPQNPPAAQSDSSSDTEGSSTPSQPAPKPSAAVDKTARVAQSAPAVSQTTPPPVALPMTQPRGAIAVPVGDTIARNPPTGLAFAGSGKYQLYRQGDITWRLDTDTGRACIIFATDMQWSRTRVWDSGCGAS